MEIPVKLWLGILMGSLSVTVANATPDGDAGRLATCVEELQIPREGPSGSPGDRIGPLSVTVVPDSQGRPKSITIEPSSNPAAILIRSWISSSTFAKRCSGLSIALQFS